jgi:poly(hydroxyalkanoate) depolymerase family esterase
VFQTGPNLRSRGVQHPPGSPFAKTAGVAGGAGDDEHFFTRSYSGAAGARSYKLYVPESYAGEAVPLVVMLHGCTQDPDDFAAGTRMNALAEEHGFLVAYPAQSGSANMQKCWNWFQAADQQRGQGEPSIIAGITQQVIEDYEVDEGRVYVAGMSAGGAMAAIMGAAYPDLYAAVGVHSGLAPGSAHDMPSAFSAMRQGNPGAPMPRAGSNGQAEVPPTVIFHGDRDGTVHPRNGDRLLAQLTATDGSALKVSTRQGQVPDGHRFTRISYRDADGRSVVERWNVHGLAHAWSGGGRPGSYTDPKGPDASAEMVRFFLQHARTK